MVILQINGSAHPVDLDGDVPLLWVLRDELQLTGTKYGCGVAQCGACTVPPRRARRPARASPPAARLGDREITPSRGPTARWPRPCRAPGDGSTWSQCGYCQSGQIMSAIALLAEKPKPTDDDVDGAMTGNLCRCATYVRIRAADPRGRQGPGEGLMHPLDRRSSRPSSLPSDGERS